MIKASEGSRSGIAGEHWRYVESAPGYHPLRMVSHLVEDVLRELTIANINEQASNPTDGEPLSVSYAAVTNAKHLV